MWTGGCLMPHNRLYCFFLQCQDHSSYLPQCDPTRVTVTALGLLYEACGSMWCVITAWVPFQQYIIAPADEAWAILTWHLRTTSAFMITSSWLPWGWYPPLQRKQTLLTSCTSVCRKEEKKNRSSIDFLKLLSDVEWFSSPHALLLLWTLRLSLSRAGLKNSDLLMDLNETLSALLSP